MDTGLLGRLVDLAASPFGTRRDLVGWVIATMIVVTVSYMWTRVLEHVTEA